MLEPVSLTLNWETYEATTCAGRISIEEEEGGGPPVYLIVQSLMAGNHNKNERTEKFSLLFTSMAGKR